MTKANVARRVKKISRKHALSILKLKFKPYNLKYGVKVPGAYRYAHAQHKGLDYSTKWANEEPEEIGYLTGLDEFVKGLTYDDLLTGTPKNSILGTLRVYDAKPKPRARCC